MTTAQLLELNRSIPLSHELVNAIKTFPVAVVAEHCGTLISISPFEIYATCPTCKSTFKCRSFSGTAEIQDVFDAVFEWLRSPDAQAAFRRRQQQIERDE